MMRSWAPLLLSLTVFGCGDGLERLKVRCHKGEPEACVQACEKGEPGKTGCLGASEAFLKGDGVQKNEKRATALAIEACEGRSAEGCAFAATLTTGDEALTLNGKACDLGDQAACDLVLTAHIEEATNKHKEGSIPTVLAALKAKCSGKTDGCSAYTKWMKTCAEAWFMYDGITGLKCPEYEPECKTQRMAATKPFCSGVKNDNAAKPAGSGGDEKERLKKQLEDAKKSACNCVASDPLCDCAR